MLKVIEPKTPEHFDAVRRLCWDYRDFLLTLDERSRCIVHTLYSQEKYARVMEDIEVIHCPPNGGTRLALKDGKPVGCGMFHTIEPGVAEIKRVFVTEFARGTGSGFAIMQSLIDACRAQGYDYIRMDTGKPLEAATRLYLSMGFELRDSYSEVPEVADGHLLFFEMKLTSKNAD